MIDTMPKKREGTKVYHGTFGQFKSFDSLKLGTNTETPSAKLGFFFATNQKVATGYASTTFQKLVKITDTITEAEKTLKDLTGDDSLTVTTKNYNNKYYPEIATQVKKLLAKINKAEGALAEYENIGHFEEVELAKSGTLKEVNLVMKNPLVYDMKGQEHRDKSFYDIINEAKKNGHDSVIIKNTYDSAVYATDELTDIHIVFDRSQIG